MSHFLDDRRTSIDRIDSASLFILSERARLIFKIWLQKKMDQTSLDISEERKQDLEKIYELVDQSGLRRSFVEKLFSTIYQRSQEMFREFKEKKLVEEELIWGETLDTLRDQLYHLDVAYVHLLAERFVLVKTIGAYKHEMKISPLDPSRWETVLAARIHLASQLHVSPEFVKNTMELIHEEALYLERSQA